MRYTRKPKKTNAEQLQPVKCRGCIWGRFEGSKQFCSKPKCLKEEKGGGKL